MEINRSYPEKEVDIEEKFTDISTGQECSFSFSAIRSKARSESCVGKRLHSSLQTCEARNNLDKLEGLLKCTKSKSLGKTLNGLIFILNQRLVQSKHANKTIGFISFKDACGFFDSAPEEASFHDHLLHEDHGQIMCYYNCSVWKTVHFIKK